MMKWMQHYAQPCPLLCCRSADCATIQCSFCLKSLTSAIGSPPAPRFECAECDPVASESFTTGRVVIASATTMCGKCFIDGHAAPHRHSALFLHIDPAGHHSSCSRPVPAAPVSQLLQAHFAPALQVHGQCVCCDDTFSADQPAVYSAFCRKGHGIDENKKGGKTCEPFDSRSFYCGTCAFRFAEAKGQTNYDWPDSMCRLCVHEKEMAKWKEEFQREKLDAEAEGCCGARARLLRTIHTQPWIKAVVDEVFYA
jgi:hypothetical protein